jgi:competence protein ComEC
MTSFFFSKKSPRRMAWGLALVFCLSLTGLGLAAPAPSRALADDLIQLGGPSPFLEGTALLEVFFLNVGQGDAIFLRVGPQTLLIDGGYPDSFTVLKDFLTDRHGSLKLGSLLFTHAHEDHIANLITLLRWGGNARRAYGPLAPESRDDLFRSLLSQMETKSIPYARLFSGDCLELGGQAPDRGATPIQSEAHLTQGSALLRVLRWEDPTQDVNAGSLILQVEYGLRTLLLTADITGVAQHHFFKTYGSSLASDILKSPHHGVEPMQSDFLDAVSPDLVVVTNRPAAVSQLGRQLARRDLPAVYSGQGTLYLATDGERWYLS